MKNEKNMFEVATRSKYRFAFKGLITVEDLWDLTVKELDSIFKALNAQLKQSEEESLLGTKSKKDEEIAIKVEIIKYVVQVKLEEEQLRLKTKELKEQKQKILEILANKQDANLQNKSIEELQAMLSELDK